MDEFLSKSAEALSGLQVNIRMTTENARQFSEETLAILRQPSQINLNLKNAANNVYSGFLEIIEKAKIFFNPDVITEQFRLLFRDEISRNNAFFLLVGFGFGTAGGLLIGVYLSRPYVIRPLMKCVASVSFEEPDNITLIRTPRPTLINNSHEILIKVKAAALDRLDDRISRGYGRFLRNVIQKIDSYNNPELPLLLGRSCSGIVEALGNKTKSGLEIGDEVWVAADFWAKGLAAEYVVVNENQVGKKPFIIGFESAASLPYSGCVALNSIKNLNKSKIFGKRIFIEDGCSSVGCVLIQILKKWGAFLTTSCFYRSEPVVKALGAEAVITYGFEKSGGLFMHDVNNIDQVNLINELNLQDKFDLIFLTRRLNYDCSFLKKFLNPGGVIIDCNEEPVKDNLSYFMRVGYKLYVTFKQLVSNGQHIEWGENHFNTQTLDRLAMMVNDGVLQTVVDGVFTAELDNCERALKHICKDKRIGGTIITFR